MAITISEGKHYRQATGSVITTAQDIVDGRFVDFGGAYPVAGARAFGVSSGDVSSGEQLLIITGGVADVETGGRIDVNDPLTTDATGKAVVAGAGDQISGYAVESSLGADEIIKIKVV